MLRKPLILLALIFLAVLAASRLPPEPTSAPSAPAEIEETDAPADAPAAEGVEPGEALQSGLADRPAAADLYAVVRVVDGDTIVVEQAGAAETVRLIGVDTPETVHPSRPVQCFGREASDQTKRWLTGARVILEFDPSQGAADKYGRTLAYVRREDGLFINQALIEGGYAHEYTYRLPYRYQREFQQAEQRARDNAAGLWAPDACAAIPADENL